jgi:hypothetical protein
MSVTNSDGLTIIDIDSTHADAMFDTDEAITINTDTKDFSFGKNFNNVIGVVGDHNSEIVSFKIDRFIENHDISQCMSHRIFWKNTDTNKSDKDDLSIKVLDDNIVLLSWLISDKVTESAGNLEFAVHISDYDSNGQLCYRWKTKPGNGLRIENGFIEEEYQESIPKCFVSMIDQETGKKYRLYVSNGKLLMEESEE